jgi:hypothetical protein
MRIVPSGRRAMRAFDVAPGEPLRPLPRSAPLALQDTQRNLLARGDETALYRSHI